VVTGTPLIAENAWAKLGRWRKAAAAANYTTGQQAARLRRVQRIARLLDTAFRIPGTRFQFGLDSIAGLFPAAGDALMALLSLYIVYEATQLGVSKRTRWKMLLNVFVDLGLGSVPVAGDVFDLFYKANLRNVRLLEAELQRSRNVASPDELSRARRG
jgi:hypothetical protein